MDDFVEYTANDEMPECGMCDHICDDFDCCKFCGAEHGWWGYRRTEIMRNQYKGSGCDG